MINYDATLIAELAKEFAAAFWWVDINLATPLHYTDCDVPLVISGNRYLPRGFKISEIPSTAGFSVDHAKFELDDVDRAISAAFLSADPAGKEVVLGLAVALWQEAGAVSGEPAFVDADVAWVDSEDVTWTPRGGSQVTGRKLTFISGIVARGGLISWDAPEKRMSIRIAGEFRFWKKIALRLPTPNCPWAFAVAGGECDYAGGETWCDQSPERCLALGNWDNFGGRKFISAIENAKIYWGPAGF